MSGIQGRQSEEWTRGKNTGTLNIFVMMNENALNNTLRVFA